jgi:hypothetical protein
MADPKEGRSVRYTSRKPTIGNTAIVSTRDNPAFIWSGTFLLPRRGADTSMAAVLVNSKVAA